MPDSSPIPTDDFERHRAAVTRYIRYLVRNAAEAEDLTQEVFLRAHSNRENLRDAQAMESWLFQIATHASIDRMRQRARAVERAPGQPVEDLPISDRNQPSALTMVQQSEMSACVQKYVAKLSDAYKAVLLMHDTDGLTTVEIAELLKLPLTTVKMRLHRARRQLQATLNDACAFESDERGVLICEPKPRSQ